MSDLPVTSLLPELAEHLQRRDELVLEAPPGAGKTTLVPLSLLNAACLTGQKILLLEPRRLAARAAAERMAQLLQESVGQTVGYRVRLDTCVSSATRIEVVTEGVLGRLLQDDPALEGYGLVIFDEFHERSLDADVGLALCLQSRALFSDLRDQRLKLLVMSATLDGARIAELLGNAPVLRSEGCQYPVTIHYRGTPSGEPLLESMVALIIEAWQRHTGSILVFLPGQGEIRRCESRLRQQLPDCRSLYPLYGSLNLEEQRRAVLPTPSGQRKIVLATSLAESSLTIEGVTVVVDSGLQRQSAYDPATAMNRLHTRRVSRASATQRSGRAGRLQEGVCYRLWSEEEQCGLAEYGDPEILQADLAGMALQLLQWGVDRPGELQWLDAPPDSHYQQALALLVSLGAVSKTGRLSAHGEAMTALPLHPRLAHMLLRARQLDAAGDQNPGFAALACELAALLVERDFLAAAGSDIGLRVAAVRGEYRVQRSQQAVLQRIRKQCGQFRRLLGLAPEAAVSMVESDVAMLLALAYPDRIARQRSPGGREYQLANGRSASLREGDSLCNVPWLVVAEVGGQSGRSSDQIYRAASLDPVAFGDTLVDLVEEQFYCDWDDERQRFIAERRAMVGRLIWRSEALTPIPAERKMAALLALLRRRGLGLLNWSEDARQLRARVQLLRGLDIDSPLPDMSEAGLLATLESWLGPYLAPVKSLADFARLDCEAMLLSQLEWDARQSLDRQLPVKIRVPSGSGIRIDYTQSPPVLAVKLQEMFGCEATPLLADGRVPLMIYLLSPARRPLQITQDLASFWRGSYAQVKKEMKGRYPKHPWPDNPFEAPPTAKTKHRRKP